MLPLDLGIKTESAQLPALQRAVEAGNALNRACAGRGVEFNSLA